MESTIWHEHNKSKDLREYPEEIVQRLSQPSFPKPPPTSRGDVDCTRSTPDVSCTGKLFARDRCAARLRRHAARRSRTVDLSSPRAALKRMAGKTLNQFPLGTLEGPCLVMVMPNRRIPVDGTLVGHHLGNGTEIHALSQRSVLPRELIESFPRGSAKDTRSACQGGQFLCHSRNLTKGEGL